MQSRVNIVLSPSDTNISSQLRTDHSGTHRFGLTLASIKQGSHVTLWGTPTLLKAMLLAALGECLNAEKLPVEKS
jgi:hypothetical protein